MRKQQPMNSGLKPAELRRNNSIPDIALRYGSDTRQDGAQPEFGAAVAAFARLMHRPAIELPAHQGFVIQQGAAIAPPADRPVRQDPLKHPVRARLPRKDRLRVAGHGRPSPSRETARFFGLPSNAVPIGGRFRASLVSVVQ